MATFNWREPHHLYIGAGLIVLSFFLHSFWHYATLISGSHLFFDDLGQEIIKLKDPSYRSPINILFRYLWGSVFGSWWPFKF